MAWSNGETCSVFADRYSYPRPRRRLLESRGAHGSLTTFRIATDRTPPVRPGFGRVHRRVAPAPSVWGPDLTRGPVRRRYRRPSRREYQAPRWPKMSVPAINSAAPQPSLEERDRDQRRGQEAVGDGELANRHDAPDPV